MQFERRLSSNDSNDNLDPNKSVKGSQSSSDLKKPHQQQAEHSQLKRQLSDSSYLLELRQEATRFTTDGGRGESVAERSFESSEINPDKRTDSLEVAFDIENIKAIYEEKHIQNIEKKLKESKLLKSDTNSEASTSKSAIHKSEFSYEMQPEMESEEESTFAQNMREDILDFHNQTQEQISKLEKGWSQKFITLDYEWTEICRGASYKESRFVEERPEKKPRLTEIYSDVKGLKDHLSEYSLKIKKYYKNMEGYCHVMKVSQERYMDGSHQNMKACSRDMIQYHQRIILYAQNMIQYHEGIIQYHEGIIQYSQNMGRDSKYIEKDMQNLIKANIDLDGRCRAMIQSSRDMIEGIRTRGEDSQNMDEDSQNMRKYLREMKKDIQNMEKDIQNMQSDIQNMQSDIPNTIIEIGAFIEKLKPFKEQMNTIQLQPLKQIYTSIMKRHQQITSGDRAWTDFKFVNLIKKDLGNFCLEYEEKMTKEPYMMKEIYRDVMGLKVHRLENSPGMKEEIRAFIGKLKSIDEKMDEIGTRIETRIGEFYTSISNQDRFQQLWMRESVNSKSSERQIRLGTNESISTTDGSFAMERDKQITSRREDFTGAESDNSLIVNFDDACSKYEKDLADYKKQHEEMKAFLEDFKTYLEPRIKRDKMEFQAHKSDMSRLCREKIHKIAFYGMVASPFVVGGTTFLVSIAPAFAAS
jgi:hypothetical protein